MIEIDRYYIKTCFLYSVVVKCFRIMRILWQLIYREQRGNYECRKNDSVFPTRYYRAGNQ